MFLDDCIFILGYILSNCLVILALIANPKTRNPKCPKCYIRSVQYLRSYKKYRQVDVNMVSDLTCFIDVGARSFLFSLWIPFIEIEVFEQVAFPSYSSQSQLSGSFTIKSLWFIIRDSLHLTSISIIVYWELAHAYVIQCYEVCF